MPQPLIGLRCVTRADFRTWLHFVRIIPPRHRPTTQAGIRRLFCEDCTPEYQAEMQAERRCTKGAT